MGGVPHPIRKSGLSENVCTAWPCSNSLLHKRTLMRRSTVSPAPRVVYKVFSGPSVVSWLPSHQSPQPEESPAMFWFLCWTALSMAAIFLMWCFYDSWIFSRHNHLCVIFVAWSLEPSFYWLLMTSLISLSSDQQGIDAFWHIVLNYSMVLLRQKFHEFSSSYIRCMRETEWQGCAYFYRDSLSSTNRTPVVFSFSREDMITYTISSIHGKNVLRTGSASIRSGSSPMAFTSKASAAFSPPDVPHLEVHKGSQKSCIRTFTDCCTCSIRSQDRLLAHGAGFRCLRKFFCCSMLSIRQNAPRAFFSHFGCLFGNIDYSSQLQPQANPWSVLRHLFQGRSFSTDFRTDYFIDISIIFRVCGYPAYHLLGL